MTSSSAARRRSAAALPPGARPHGSPSHIKRRGDARRGAAIRHVERRRRFHLLGAVSLTQPPSFCAASRDRRGNCLSRALARAPAGSPTKSHDNNQSRLPSAVVARCCLRARGSTAIQHARAAAAAYTTPRGGRALSRSPHRPPSGSHLSAGPASHAPSSRGRASTGNDKATRVADWKIASL